MSNGLSRQPLWPSIVLPEKNTTMSQYQEKKWKHGQNFYPHPKCTYMVRLGCESRASVPKLHPNLIEASESDDIVVSWQGDGRLLTNLETREANKQDGIPKNRWVRQAEDMFGKSKKNH